MKQMKFVCVLLALILVFTGCAASEKQPEEKKEDHLFFTANGTDVAMNAQAQPVLDALGSPSGVTEAPGCATSDAIRTYDYGSFFLETYQAEDGFRIYGAWFADENASTAEGIHIGSTTEEVKAAYGTVEDMSCGGYSYGSCIVRKGEEMLYIYLENDVVNSIQYSIAGGKGC